MSCCISQVNQFMLNQNSHPFQGEFLLDKNRRIWFVIKVCGLVVCYVVYYSMQEIEIHLN